MSSRHRHRSKMPDPSRSMPSNGRRTSIDSQGGVDAELGHASLTQPFLNGDTLSTHDHDHDHDTPLLTTSETKSLKRSLAQRHLSMLALAGSIGTGLFLSLGQAIQRAGPLGSLLAYAVVGFVVCAVQFALGETAALVPVTGSFVRHAEMLLDPAWGFAVGWNLVYGNLVSVPVEATAVCVLVRYWGWGIHDAVVILVFWVATVGVGMARVRVFGEVEFVFALVKVTFVVFLVILGLIIDLGWVPGQEAIGLRYWSDPGPFVEYIATGDWGRFLGFWAVMTGAVFSFAGVESLAMAAAETKNPREAIPRACKRVFGRVVVFYMLAVFVVGLLVPSNDPRLDGSGDTVAQSPFVIAAQQAGIPAIASLVNAVVITSAWSAANQSLLAGTRVLYGLALKGQAPKIFLRTTSWGTPYICVGLFAIFILLSLLSLSESAITVFWWLVSLTAAGVLVSWATILLNHIRLLKAMKKQGYSTTKLPWHNWWTEYSSPLAFVTVIVFLLTGGFSVFTKGNWDAAKFVSSYLDIPIVSSAFLFWKYTKKTSIVSLDEVPLEMAFCQIEEYPNEPEPPVNKRGWIHALSWLWD